MLKYHLGLFAIRFDRRDGATLFDLIKTNNIFAANFERVELPFPWPRRELKSSIIRLYYGHVPAIMEIIDRFFNNKYPFSFAIPLRLFARRLWVPERETMSGDLEGNFSFVILFTIFYYLLFTKWSFKWVRLRSPLTDRVPLSWRALNNCVEDGRALKSGQLPNDNRRWDVLCYYLGSSLRLASCSPPSIISIHEIFAK